MLLERSPPAETLQKSCRNTGAFVARWLKITQALGKIFPAQAPALQKDSNSLQKVLKRPNIRP